MNDLEKILALLKAKLSEEDNILFAVLFGSYARNEQNDKSDVDVAIYYRLLPTNPLATLNYSIELSKVIGKEIDLVVLNSASALLRHEVFKDGENILINEEEIYHNFRIKTMTDYDEYKFMTRLF